MFRRIMPWVYGRMNSRTIPLANVSSSLWLDKLNHQACLVLGCCTAASLLRIGCIALLRVTHVRYQYDGANSDGESCKITEYKQNLVCNITFEVTEDIPGPAYVFYELTNFYQNHQT